MGLGRICDAGLAALPGGRAQRSAELQLVEPLCALRPTAAAPRSRDPSPIAAGGRGAGNQPRRSDHGGVDQHSWRGQASAAVMDRSEPLSERIAQYCGAVDPSGVLGTDLGANSNALSSSGGSQPRLVWAPAKIAGVAPANRSRETDAATGVWATRKASGVGFNYRL